PCLIECPVARLKPLSQFLSPLRGLSLLHHYPRLAPWAAFLRRSAAGSGHHRCSETEAVPFQDKNQRPMRGDHASVCTSTDITAGKSRTIGFQLSPVSADAYTCPPDVPK